jgi:N4-gp56 family major capsid protein
MAVFDNLNASSSTGVAPSVTEYHQRALLKNIRDEMLYMRDLRKVALPAHNGKVVQFRRVRPFGPVSEPLKEGVTPDGQTLTMEDLWVSIKPYGRHLEMTDEINWALIDDVHVMANEEMSAQAALTVDTVARDELMAGLNVLRPNAKATRAAIAAADVLDFATVKQAVLTLKRNKARRFADGMYHAIVGPDTVFDLTNDPNWIDISKYQDKSMIQKYEIGTIYGVRFFETTNAAVFRTSANLYVNTQDGVTRANLTVSAYDAATRIVTVTATDVTPNQAAQLCGMLVLIGGKEAQIERAWPSVDGSMAKLQLRWDIVTATGTITPAGAGTGGLPVFGTLIYGQEFGACVSLEGSGENVQIIIKPLGSSGAADPLNQRQTIGWKIKGFAASVIQDANCVRVEHAASQVSA